MVEEKKNMEQNKHEEKPQSFLAMVIFTGIFGGILWGGLAYFAHLFHFTEVHPNIVLEPWLIGDWKKGWLGTIISIVLIGIFSVVAALIYYVALRRFKQIWVGMGYGIVLFALVFFILNPIFPGMAPFGELKKTTIVTSLCFYILFGTFIGYSISYEEEERKVAEKKRNEVTS